MESITPTPAAIGPDRVMDVRPIPCSIKHNFIIRSWIDLPVGEHFILLNSHDPIPLFQQFTARWPGGFTWEYLVQEPEECRIKITKLRPLSDVDLAATTCCGGH